MSVGCHDSAIVAASACVHADARIGPFAVVGERVVVGAGARVHSHAVLENGVVLGDEVEVFSGAVIGREPKSAGATARAPVFARELVIGPGCSVGVGATVYYDVQIGAGTLIGDHASIREGARIGERCIVSRGVTLNYDVHLGDGVKVMDGTHLTGGMRVGAGAFIAALVSTANDNVPTRRLKGSGRLRGPVIGVESIIGSGAVLLPGVRIGDRAQVAAGSVVTRDVGADAVAMGVPARTRDAAGRGSGLSDL